MRESGEYTMVSALMRAFSLKLKIDLDATLPDKVGEIANKMLQGSGVPVDMFV